MLHSDAFALHRRRRKSIAAEFLATAGYAATARSEPGPLGLPALPSISLDPEFPAAVSARSRANRVAVERSP